MNRDLLKKLQNEVPLNPEEERLLEAGLASEAQQKVAQMVGRLPDEGVSLAWRSSLNEKLLAQQSKRQRRERVFWVLRPASALAIAATVWGVYLAGNPRPVATVERPNIEISMIEAHKQTETVSFVSATGMGAFDVPRNGVSNSMTIEWEEVDLGAL
ncbi:MAG: hypothetical protein SNJ74_00125 [Fimbriimonadaceae bacterium]